MMEYFYRLFYLIQGAAGRSQLTPVNKTGALMFDL